MSMTLSDYKIRKAPKYLTRRLNIHPKKPASAFLNELILGDIHERGARFELAKS